jgi:long chain fatty acid CoA FadD26
MQLLATHAGAFSAAPNFAFELVARRTSDDDIAELDFGDVRALISGAERIHAATIRRFYDRFARYHLKNTVIRPSYGLAEATVYVATPGPGRVLETAHFDYGQLSAGQAKRCANGTEGGSEHVSYGGPCSSMVRIVDPETRMEKPAGKVGEIWVHGKNVAKGYWRKPDLTAETFAAELINPSPGSPRGPWLRTGDLGVVSEGELFIVGRIKDMIIVDGRNHYPEDIEATIYEITGGRVAAIPVPDDQTERLVAIIELKPQSGANEQDLLALRSLKREVTSAVLRSHGLRASDLVFVPRGSVPITTSGKIRRAACVECYRNGEFPRLDASA